MSADILVVLRKHHDLLHAQYEEHLEAVRELQKTLILQILPGLADELELDEDGQQYCLEWLEDTCAFSPQFTCIAGALTSFVRVDLPNLEGESAHTWASVAPLPTHLRTFTASQIYYVFCIGSP